MEKQNISKKHFATKLIRSLRDFGMLCGTVLDLGSVMGALLVALGSLLLPPGAAVRSKVALW